MTYSEIHISPATQEELELRTESQPVIQRYVVRGGRKYGSRDFGDLIADMDELKNAPELMSRIVCHLFLKANYEFIQNAQHFQSKQLNRNLLYTELNDKHSLAQHIKAPSISGAVLHFFVSQIGTSVPYEVHFNLTSGKISLNDVAANRGL